MTPSGPIRAKNPQGGSFGLDWSRINQWDERITKACQEFVTPFMRVKATVVIESGGDPNATQINRTNGNSYGLMQIVPRGVGWAGWHQRFVDLSGTERYDPLDPLLNLRVGCSILRDFYQSTDSWDQASSKFFTGRLNWQGQDTVNGNTGEGYRTSLNALMEEIGGVADAINWEPLPRPAMVRAIVTKPYDGAGFTRTSARGPRTVGCCNHITDGDPIGDEIEWYRAFFSTGGERATDALVDTVIARNGQIGLLNDWEDPNYGGTRAGWANGDVQGLEGDGIAFYRAYPDNQINEVLVSKEHVGAAGQKMTDAQMAASIALSAYVAQKAKVRWDTYPKNDRGLVIEQLHRNFAAKACPAEPFISTYYPVLLREVKATLTKHQTGSTNPNPTPQPSEPQFVGLPDWCPPDYFKALFPKADPNGAVTKKVIGFIANYDHLPLFEKQIVVDAAANKNIWVFRDFAVFNEGGKVWLDGQEDVK